MEISSPLPPPEAVSAAVLAIAVSEQPKTVGEGLDLLRSVGIGNGPVTRAENDSSWVVAEATGAWHGTHSDLMVGADGAVEHFGAHLWFADGADTLRPGSAALIESIEVALGAADDMDFNADGSHTAYRKRRPAEVELYLHVERPRARAAIQIGITWTDCTADGTGTT